MFFFIFLSLAVFWRLCGALVVTFFFFFEVVWRVLNSRGCCYLRLGSCVCVCVFWGCRKNYLFFPQQKTFITIFFFGLNGTFTKIIKRLKGIIKISFFIYCCYIGITIVFLKISWYLGSLLHSLTSSNSFPVVFCLFVLDALPKPIMRSDNDDSFISSFPILMLFHFSCFIAVWPSSKTSNGTGESGHSSHSWSWKESASFSTRDIIVFAAVLERKNKSKELSFIPRYLWVFKKEMNTCWILSNAFSAASKISHDSDWFLNIKQSAIPGIDLTSLGYIHLFIYCCLWFTLTLL